jgi:hypothetical protein
LRVVSRAEPSRVALALPAALAAALLTAGLAGCGDDSPGDVTFSTGGRTATTGPVRSCDVQLTECESDDDAAAVLDVPAGSQLRITVPDSIATTPWQVVFRYGKADKASKAEPIEGRTKVFPPGAQHEFTLKVPAGATLETVEVQQYGAPAMVDGQPNFRIRSAWVLNGKP